MDVWVRKSCRPTWMERGLCGRGKKVHITADTPDGSERVRALLRGYIPMFNQSRQIIYGATIGRT